VGVFTREQSKLQLPLIFPTARSVGCPCASFPSEQNQYSPRVLRRSLQSGINLLDTEITCVHLAYLRIFSGGRWILCRYQPIVRSR
jgi:hypothetical protein